MYVYEISDLLLDKSEKILKHCKISTEQKIKLFYNKILKHRKRSTGKKTIF